MQPKKTIEIVTHCWAGQLRIYAYLLKSQIESLVYLSRPFLCQTQLTVVYHPKDQLTVEVLDWGEKALALVDVKLKRLAVPTNLLFQRSIGRNIAATATEADVVWFTDCDYLFSVRCLDAALTHSLSAPSVLVYPATVAAHKTHALGDDSLARHREPFFDRFDPAHFSPRSYGKAIGGIQIISGDYCRSFGYLRDSKWSRAMTDTKGGFAKCRGDVRFRKAVGRSLACDIPGVYRIRHSEVGRDASFTDTGTG